MKSVSLKSNRENKMRLTRRDVLILALASFLVVVAYLVTSALTYKTGFPLDDSWIHQTYARNLALRHEWSFVPGQASAGSTAPLWTLLLAVGFFLPLAPYLWTYLLGWLLLFGLGVLGEGLLRSAGAIRRSPEPADGRAPEVGASYAPHIPWAGLFFILEWHMTWAAVSGMETLLHILIVTATLGMLMIGSRRYLPLGLLVGLSVWVRPDGLTLLGPLVVYALLTERNSAGRVRALFLLTLGFAVLFAPYLLFNLALSGTPMPNTFYAKQAEYAIQPGAALNTRLSLYGLQFLIGFLQFFGGVSLAVLPGFIQKIRVALRRREWGILLSALWVLGYTVLYLSRLPAYQHGRYLMPAMGVFLLIGLMGFVEFLPSLRTQRTRLFRRVALVAIVMFSVAFGGFGAFTYGQDVGLIESEMVVTAKWVAQNTPPGALIAAHDIGALGFFGGHPIVDLAGLISPDVVPFIRDQARLADYMDQRRVDYLVAFPYWYPELAQRGSPVFASGGEFVPQTGHENMVIYRWKRP